MIIITNILFYLYTTLILILAPLLIFTCAFRYEKLVQFVLACPKSLSLICKLSHHLPHLCRIISGKVFLLSGDQRN